MINRGNFFIFFLIAQIVVLQILQFFPQKIERIYSNGIYPIISRFSRFILGKIPFSIGDFLYILLLFYLLIALFKLIKNKHSFKFIFIKTIEVVSIFYFLFTILWGLNYLRIPLKEKMNFSSDYTKKDLEIITLQLIEKTNLIHLQITKDSTKKIVIPYSIDSIYSKSITAFTNLEKKYPDFAYTTPSVKKSLWSIPLSYMGFGGYLNPFTNEAQVNYKIPKYNFPTTTCHEISHQIGIASESEANLVGFLASINSNDIYFNYSGYSFALKYCLSNFEKIKEGSSKRFHSKINPGILKNFEESKIFWESHQTFIEPIFESFYDSFLKANQQEDGMEGYSKFIGLLIGLNKKQQIVPTPHR